MKPSTEKEKKSEATPEQKDGLLTTESITATTKAAQADHPNPRVVDVTEEWLGKSLIFVSAPPRSAK